VLPPKPRRKAAPRLIWLAGALAFSAVPAMAAGETSDGQAAPEAATVPEASAETSSEADTATLEADERYAHRKRQIDIALRTEDWEDAERVMLESLQDDLSEERRAEILLRLAKLLDERGRDSRRAVVLERFIEAYPKHPKVAGAMMDLGLLYREFGAFDRSIERFYSVLNQALSVPEEQLSNYQVLTLRAQYEIAETHFLMREYEEAIDYYSRLRLLELSDVDRAEVSFKRAHATYLLGKYPAVIEALKHYVQQFPQSPRTPEAHYLLSRAFKKTGQTQAALRQVLTLLTMEINAPGNSPERALYWKRKTGNSLATDFFQEGDFISALKIYRAMTPLRDDAEWQVPVIYQIGLCFERLRMPPKASEAYSLIEEMLPKDSPLLSENRELATIREMAQWRREHLGWQTDANTRLQDLLSAHVEAEKADS
jgi:tetratricopeptide (TPR) repeat protein